MMPPRIRKFTLALHLTASVGWIGAVVVYLVMVVVAMLRNDAQILRAVWIALELTGWLALIPLSLAALLTGIVLSLGTKWGLFQHYWVLISLVLTTVATTVLIQHMPTVSAFAALATQADSADAIRLREGLEGELLHGGLGLLVLLVIQVLNVYKPRGITVYGWRKQQAQRSLARSVEA